MNSLRILHKKIKDGYVKIYIDKKDDLWHIQNFIEEGDIVRALTYRRSERNEDIPRAKRSEKLPMTISVEVEKKEYQPFGERLRIFGKIVDAPQDIGKHHTIILKEKMEVKIIKKKWNASSDKILDECIRSTRMPEVLFIAIDDEMARAIVMTSYGLKEIAEYRVRYTGKDEAYSMDDEYKFNNVIKIIDGEGRDVIVIVGPGRVRERLEKFLKEKGYKKVYSAHASHGDMRGVYECMKKGVISDIISDCKIAEDTQAVDALLQEIKKNGNVTYGVENVKRASEMGAIDNLLVCSKIVCDDVINNIIENCKKSSSEINIISYEHEAGKILNSLGGIAAFLRWKIE